MPPAEEYKKRPRRQTEYEDTNPIDYVSQGPGKKRQKTTTGSRKGDEVWQAILKWRNEHAHLDLPDIVTSYKNGKSASSGHHW